MGYYLRRTDSRIRFFAATQITVIALAKRTLVTSLFSLNRPDLSCRGDGSKSRSNL